MRRDGGSARCIARPVDSKSRGGTGAAGRRARVAPCRTGVRRHDSILPLCGAGGGAGRRAGARGAAGGGEADADNFRGGGGGARRTGGDGSDRGRAATVRSGVPTDEPARGVWDDNRDDSVDGSIFRRQRGVGSRETGSVPFLAARPRAWVWRGREIQSTKRTASDQ